MPVLAQKRRPVGGDDRAPRLSEALGGNPDPQGKRGRLQEGFDPLRFWMLKWVSGGLRKMRITHVISAKMHTASRNFSVFALCCAAFCRSCRGGCMAGLRKRRKQSPRK